MNKEIECETCIKRKTMYCPNSSECMSTEDKPHYQNRIMLLEEKQHLEHNWNELKKYIEEQKDYLTKITGQHIPLNDSFEFCSMNELYQTGKYSGLKDTLIKMQSLEEGGNNDC